MHTENWFFKMIRDAIFKLLFWGGDNCLFMKIATKEIIDDCPVKFDKSRWGK